MAAIPPGNEANILKDLKKLQIQNEILGFLKNDSVPDFSSYKDHSYIYKMS